MKRSKEECKEDDIDAKRKKSDAEDDLSNTPTFCRKRLHMIRASEFVDKNFDAVTNREKEPWELSWLHYVEELEKKWEEEQSLTTDEVKNITNNWIEALEDMKMLIVARAVVQSMKAMSEYTPYDITVDDRKFNLVTELLLRLNSLLQMDMRSFKSISNLNSKLEMEKERKKKQAISDQAEQHEWNSLKQNSETQQLKYFIKMYGPSKGKKEYTQWKSCVLLYDGAVKISNSFERNLQSLDQKLNSAEDILGSAKGPFACEILRKRTKDDPDYDELLDGDLF